MRRYETMVIVDPDVAEQERTGLFGRFGELIDGHAGYLVDTDEWGTRKLAYPIKKKPRGFYLRLDYCGTGDLVNELERNMRIEDRVLKFMTVLLEEDVDVEALKEEAARKEAEQAAAEQQEAEQAAAQQQKAEQAAAEAAPSAEPDAEAASAVEPEAEAAPAAASPNEPAAAPAEAPEAESQTDAAAEKPAPAGESDVKEGT